MRPAEIKQTVVYTSKCGWIQHAGGTGRLIEARGPERHQDYPNHGFESHASWQDID